MTLRNDQVSAGIDYRESRFKRNLIELCSGEDGSGVENRRAFGSNKLRPEPEPKSALLLDKIAGNIPPHRVQVRRAEGELRSCFNRDECNGQTTAENMPHGIRIL